MIAYQTYVVHVLAVFSIFLALMATHLQELGINNPWFTLVLIPGGVAAVFYAGNQMKSVGAPPPGTKKTTTEETIVPPAP